MAGAFGNLCIYLGGVDLGPHFPVVLKKFQRQPACAAPVYKGAIEYPLDFSQFILDLVPVIEDIPVPGCRFFCRCRDDRIEQFIHTFPLMADRLYDWGPEEPGKLLDIELVSSCFGLVAHIESEHEGYARFHELDREVKVPLKIGRIDDIDDHIGLLIHNEVPCYEFLGRIRGQTVSPGQVDKLEFHVFVPTVAFLALNGDAWIIAHMLPCTGQVIEDGSLSRIWISC